MCFRGTGFRGIASIVPVSRVGVCAVVTAYSYARHPSASSDRTYYRYHRPAATSRPGVYPLPLSGTQGGRPSMLIVGFIRFTKSTITGSHIPAALPVAKASVRFPAHLRAAVGRPKHNG
uniref:Uncharacterized protein n=1 Tax=Anopheles christyi TaxID=43041 RepID=A0A182KHZ2_9DIPT